MWIAVLVGGLVLLPWLASTRGRSPRFMPVAGTPAPEFSLSSQDHSQINLKDFRGKWVVLYFYPKDFTSGCTIEARDFQRNQPEYARRNAVVLGVSVDGSECHERFCAKEGLSFKLLADVSGRVSKEYGSLMNFGVAKISARNTFLIDPKGRIARTFAKVTPEGHSAEVLAAIDQFQGSGLWLG